MWAILVHVISLTFSEFLTLLDSSDQSLILLKEMSLTQEQQFKALYREFIRLAQYIPKLKYRVIYKDYLKRYFESPIEYIEKRSIILSDDKFAPITNEDILTRLPKTLSFIKLGCQNKKKDLNSKILENLLVFEETKLQYLEKKGRSNPSIYYNFKKLKYFTEIDKKDDLQSLREMDKLIMRLNESEKMCL